MSKFGENLKIYRKISNLTQRDLAKILNVSNGTVALWETNQRQPDYETIIKIATFFEITTDELLGNKTKDKVFLTHERIARELLKIGVTDEDFKNLPEEKKRLLFQLIKEIFDNSKNK